MRPAVFLLLFSLLLFLPAISHALSCDFNDGDPFCGGTLVALDSDGAAGSFTVSSGELAVRGDATNSDNGGDHDSILLTSQSFSSTSAMPLVVDVDFRYVSGTANPGDRTTGGSNSIGLEALYLYLRYTDADNHIRLMIDPATQAGNQLNDRTGIAIYEMIAGTQLDRGHYFFNSASVGAQRNIHVTLEDLRIAISVDNDVSGFDQLIAFVNSGPGRVGIGVPDGDSVITAGVSQFDNLSIVPEPSTVLLLGMGLLGLASQRRRFAKAH